ncbi:hypothetical protein [Streptomyces sp. NPDC001250]|uniref:hypothetical protein n=1 Tax=Streptomyces sp. NPDC001250 TaxID=3154382 RepID=UPI0033346B22
MRAEWDDAHTNYAAPARPSGPVSLSETPTQWRERLEHGTPNGWLLRGNTMLKTLAGGRPIHLRTRPRPWTRSVRAGSCMPRPAAWSEACTALTSAPSRRG